jgi:hypothetical protein
VVARHVPFSARLSRGCTGHRMYTSSTACRSLRQREGRINPISGRTGESQLTRRFASTRFRILSWAVRNRARMAAWPLVSEYRLHMRLRTRVPWMRHPEDFVLAPFHTGYCRPYPTTSPRPQPRRPRRRPRHSRCNSKGGSESTTPIPSGLTSTPRAGEAPLPPRHPL